MEAVAIELQTFIAKFAETQRTAQTDAAFAAFGTPKDIVDIVYSYVPRAVSPNDIARMFDRNEHIEIYVVGTIAINANTRVAISYSPFEDAQEMAAGSCVHDKIAHIYARVYVPDGALHNEVHCMNSCIMPSCSGLCIFM